MRILNVGELRRIIEAPDRRYPTGMRNACALMLMGYAGLTPQELSELRTADLDLPNRTINAPGGQRVAARRLGLHADLADLLRRWLASPDRPQSPWLLPAIAEPTRGGRQDPSFWSAMVPREAASVGIAGVTATALRNTFASLAANGDRPWSDAELAAALGSSVDFARSFRHIDQQAVVDRMTVPGPQPRLEDAGGPEIARLRRQITELDDDVKRLAKQIAALEVARGTVAEWRAKYQDDVNLRFENVSARVDDLHDVVADVLQQGCKADLSPRRPLADPAGLLSGEGEDGVGQVSSPVVGIPGEGAGATTETADDNDETTTAGRGPVLADTPPLQNGDGGRAGSPSPRTDTADGNGRIGGGTDGQ